MDSNDSNSDEEEARCVVGNLEQIAVRFELATAITKAYILLDAGEIVHLCAAQVADLEEAAAQAQAQHRKHRRRAEPHLSVVKPASVIRGKFRPKPKTGERT